ncbi:MAG: class I SAM-dependent rRNA methyltransferase [Bdellovibrionales bacterium]|nr:class I SAM-dependent rRNA methyltransferase [Bdellovibrionales bacterium]
MSGSATQFPVTFWKVRRGAEKRFLHGHPWIYSNELEGSPKGLPPGYPVILRTPEGRVLAGGYGNPHSLISFRALERADSRGGGGAGTESSEWSNLGRWFSHEVVKRRLAESAHLRASWGYAGVSARWAFGEADGLPGLVADRFALEAPGGPAQVLVVQVLTAGMEALLALGGPGADEGRTLLAVLEGAVRALGESELGENLSAAERIGWDRTAVVLRRDASVRELEGLARPEPLALREVPGLDLGTARVRINAAGGGEPLLLSADLRAGQKTGFFLDQNANVKLLASALRPWLELRSGRPLEVLDLFCHLGQWGAQVARLAEGAGIAARVTLMDSSAPALVLAEGNVPSSEPVKLDIVEALSEWEPERRFDVVICDPPAFIKSRKAQADGRRAYVKVFRQSLRRVRAEGGWLVACSCSHHLSDSEFDEALAEASGREGRAVRWLARGGHAPDHPVRLEFPEGRYLKCRVGWVG